MLQHTPLLQKQRDLYDLPFGRERFNAYIELMTDETRDLELPLTGLNPMGKDHLPQLLDEYLALDLDTQALSAVSEIATEPVIAQAFQQRPMQTAFVLADDLKGRWTHRVAYEFELIYAQEPLFKRHWLAAYLWSSETADVQKALFALKAVIYRGAWIAQHGFQKTLKGLIEQEGWVACQLGSKPKLAEDDLQYTQEILDPIMMNKDEPTLMTALFGDQAAGQLGHPALGLSENAGLELGLALQLSSA